MKRTWSEDELQEHWSLSPEEQALLTHKTSRGQLGFAVLLKYFQLETRFPRDCQDIPPAVVAYLAQQLGTPPETLETYDWSGHTGRHQRHVIREWLGFRTPTADDAARLVAWLRQDILSADPTESHVMDVALTWYREQGIEPPARPSCAGSSVRPSGRMRRSSVPIWRPNSPQRSARHSMRC